MSTIILTTGQPGSGKSYSRVRWLIQDYLVNSTGIYITNIPINSETISSTFSDSEYILNRLKVIPFEVLKEWEQLSNRDKNELKNLKIEDFPPYKFFTQFNLENSHIAIDEFHLYFNKNLNSHVKKLWNDFFAEIRKLGCTFEAITQDSALLPREFVGKVGKWVDLVPLKNLRDPIFKIPLADWYELRTAYFGLTEQKVQQQEKIKVSSLLSTKWKIINTENFVISSEFYKFYNSYQRNDTGKSSDYKTPSQIHGKMTIFWFLRLHFFKLLSKIFLAAIIIWVCFGGGLLSGIRLFTKTLNKISTKNGIVKNEKKKRNVVNSSIALSDKQVSDSPIDEGQGEYLPALFFEGVAWLRNGERVYVGYKFTKGVYNGKKVVKISASDRKILLDNGDTLFMYSK